MTEYINFPALGESVTEGVITRWLKNVGDEIRVGDSLVEVSTDKVDTEIPSNVFGILERILVTEDETVRVGEPIAEVNVFANQSDPTGPPDKPSDKTESEVPSNSSAETSGAIQGESIQDEKSIDNINVNEVVFTYATPIVRQLARQLGVDLKNLQGSGVGGRITKEDVLSHKALQFSADDKTSVLGNSEIGLHHSDTSQSLSEKNPKSLKMSRLRKVIAERAVQSMHATAQLSTFVEVDVTKLVNYRNAIKDAFFSSEGIKLTFLPFFIMSAAKALRKHKIINSHLQDDSIIFSEHENISIAVDTERGLITPVIKQVGDMSITQIARSLSDLAKRAREGSLKPDEMSGGTFTVTNTGSRGALFDTPIVFLPQLAIMGIGAIVKRPVVLANDSIAIRSMVYLVISYDHRVIDGADAARFLGSVKLQLENGPYL